MIIQSINRFLDILEPYSFNVNVPSNSNVLRSYTYFYLYCRAHALHIQIHIDSEVHSVPTARRPLIRVSVAFRLNPPPRLIGPSTSFGFSKT